jgi:tRNA1Val (adenine37-N6)-methyltransferase
VSADLEPRPDETLDRLTSRMRLLQKRRGHRAATDDTLLAWAASRAQAGASRILDLGTGKGTVAMLLLQRLPGARAIGVEAVAASCDLAVRNAALNALAERFAPRLGDLRDPSLLAGEAPFDLVTGAPPFVPLGRGVLPRDETRAAGRFELRGGVRDYASAAARHLAADGAAVILMDGLGRSDLRAREALRAEGLHVRAVVEVLPRPGAAPTYRIFEARRKGGAVALSTLCLRPETGDTYSEEYEAVRRELDLA